MGFQWPLLGDLRLRPRLMMNGILGEFRNTTFDFVFFDAVAERLVAVLRLFGMDDQMLVLKVI